MAYIGNTPDSILQGRRATYAFTATNGQTVFSGVDDTGNTLDLLQAFSNDVYLNGSRLVENDDFTISGDTLTLTVQAAANDILVITTQNEVANVASYTKAETDSRYINYNGDIVNGDLQVVGNVTLGSGTANGVTYLNGSNVLTSGSALTFDGTNLKFGDNAKAIFGASSDLQIYHDGSNSYISDQGTGNLYIQGSSYIQLQDSDGNVFISCVDDGTGGRVQLRNEGSTKLATTSTGIDVTGGVVASGDIFANGGDVDIAGAQPRINLHESDTTDLDVTLRLNAGDFIIETRSGAGAALGDRIRAHSNGDISFYEDTGTTAKFFWDANVERLGIGTSSPSTTLDITTTSATPLSVNRLDTGSASIQVSNSTHSTYFGTRTGGGFAIDDDANLGDGPWLLIDNDGNMGIGTTSPASKLHITGSGSVSDNCFNVSTPANDNVLLGANLVVDVAGTYTKPATSISGAGILFEGINALNKHGSIQFLSAPDDNTGSATPLERMRIDDTGNVGIGTTSPSANLHVVGANDYDVNAKFNGSIQTYNVGSSTRAYGFLSVNSAETAVGGNLRLDASITTGSHVGYSKGTDVRGGTGIVFENTSLGSSAYGATKFVQSNDTNDDTWVVRETMRIDSAGRVTMPYQPNFRARNISSFSTNGSGTAVVFASADHNVGGHYSTTTGRFTAPVSGHYLFGAHLQPVNSGQQVNINFIVNGSSLSYSTQGWVSLPSRGDISITTNLYLNAGDYVQAYAYSSASCTWDNHGIFFGYLIG